MMRYRSAFLVRRYSSHASTIVAEILKSKIKEAEVSITDVPAMKKITVISPSFDYKSKAEQQDFVYNLLPEDWKSKVIIQIQSSGQRIKREIREVHIRHVDRLTEKVLPQTPQNFIDDAVYHLEKKNGQLASECVWHCGNSALKNFSIIYGKDMKGHEAKNRYLDILASQFGDDILSPWNILERCHANAYDNRMTFKMIKVAFGWAEQFCHLLYKYHTNEPKFDFMTNVPDWMHEKTEVNGKLIELHKFYFKDVSPKKLFYPWPR